MITVKQEIERLVLESEKKPHIVQTYFEYYYALLDHSDLTLDEFFKLYPQRQSITNTLASNIKFLRINTKVEKFNGKVKYMTQTDLAEFINSKTQQVSKFELAKNQMSAIQLYKVAKTFGVSVDNLFTDMTKSDYKKTIKQDIYCL